MSENSQLSSKERSINFTRDETNKLMLVLKDYPIITCKKTDHASNQQKDAAWRLLTETFNSDATRYRTTKQLQQKYNNMKKTARKEMAVEKYGRRQTGGGPAPPKPSETTEWLNAIMGESISGLPAVYDSDALDITVLPAEDTSTANINIDSLDKEIEEKCTSPLTEDFCNNIGKTTELQFDSSTPRAMLRKPISKELYTGKKRKITYTPLETRKRIILQSEKKMDLMSQKEAREHQLAKYAKEEQETNMRFKNEAHQQAMLHREELHKIELKYREEMHRLVLEKCKYELEKAKHAFNIINECLLKNK